MLNDLTAYLLVLFDKYQVVASIAIPSVIVAAALKMIERFKDWGGTRAAVVIGYARIGIMVVAVFWIGFLAWRDEHAARVVSEQRTNDPGIRLKDEISKLPKDIDGLKPGDLWNNGGSIAVVQ